jgi:hypothetical protein
VTQTDKYYGKLKKFIKVLLSIPGKADAVWLAAGVGGTRGAIMPLEDLSYLAGKASGADLTYLVNLYLAAIRNKLYKHDVKLSAEKIMAGFMKAETRYNFWANFNFLGFNISDFIAEDKTPHPFCKSNMYDRRRGLIDFIISRVNEMREV